MTKILIAGATGLVGGIALASALSDDRITQVVAPTRRPLPPHPRLNNPVVDFSSLPLEAEWWAVDGAVSALGTTRAVAGSAEAFRKIEGYIVSVAKALHAHGVRRFALTSSKGANPGSPFLYMRTKGEIEQEILGIGFPSLTIARPGLIGGQRNTPRLAERVTEALLDFMQPVLPASLRVCPASEISRVLLEGALRGAEGVRIVEAAEIASARKRP
jgi:uncharacterized protein YbjT (DUF2867 family)